MKSKSENTTRWPLPSHQTARLYHCSYGQATAGVSRFCKEENQFLSVSFPIQGSSTPINQNSLLFGQLGGPALTWGNTVALSVSQAVGCPSRTPSSMAEHRDTAGKQGQLASGWQPRVIKTQEVATTGLREWLSLIK